MTLIIAHRGRGWGHTENTVPAFRAALESGADGVECDFRLARDGQLFICHDRLIRGHASEELTRPERRALQFPDLEEILDLEADWPGRYFFLEAKTLEAGKALLERHSWRPGLVLLAASDEVASLARENEWEAVLLEAGSAEFLRDRLPPGAHPGPAAEIAGQFSGEEIKDAFVWTVNDLHQVQKLQEASAWAIGTDFVSEARGVF